MSLDSLKAKVDNLSCLHPGIHVFLLLIFSVLYCLAFNCSTRSKCIHSLIVVALACYLQLAGDLLITKVSGPFFLSFFNFLFVFF